MKIRCSAACRTTLALALAAAGALTWSGCGPDNSNTYCDSTGCYTCDGYGCSQNPPGPDASPLPDSGGNPDSGGGGDSANPVDAGSDSKGGDAAVCQGPSDCKAGQVCYKGGCVTCGGTSGPCPCTTTMDCSNGYLCAGGSCTPPSDTCKFSSDCSSGQVCVDNQCEAQCGTGGTCPTGQQCTNGACQPSGTSCQSNADCSSGTPYCVSGQCAAACTTGADGASQCPAGDYCNQGACVVGTPPAGMGECTSDSMCMPSRQSCIANYCRYKCTTDMQCLLIDALIPYCGTDGYCYSTQAEAHPQCTQQSDCPNGQQCISNVCL